uniref:Uncharacterized protein n=1 Tax=Ananas comosus var. bracteatus TaxID=296719 RepID=A0A6V7PZ88_ANACO|nr:unnamed protein product [Ananas comosus var. bracteatus]
MDQNTLYQLKIPAGLPVPNLVTGTRPLSPQLRTSGTGTSPMLYRYSASKLQTREQSIQKIHWSTGTPLRGTAPSSSSSSSFPLAAAHHYHLPLSPNYLLPPGWGRGCFDSDILITFDIAVVGGRHRLPHRR